jgi:hypothetical protein
LEHYHNMERRSREYEDLHRMLGETHPACCGSRSPNRESCTASPVEQSPDIADCPMCGHPTRDGRPGFCSATCQEQASDARAMLEQASAQEPPFPHHPLQRRSMTREAISPMRLASARQLPSPRTCWSEAQTFAR